MNSILRTKNYAAIDIGSNAVRLLIKKVSSRGEGMPDKFSKTILLRVPLRLGFDVFAKGKISKSKEKNLRRLMKSYQQLMKIYDVEAYRACATSAMRDAENGKEIIKKVRKSTGIEIEIIDGQEEAQMIYNNHIAQDGRPGAGMSIRIRGGGSITQSNDPLFIVLTHTGVPPFIFKWLIIVLYSTLFSFSRGRA